MTGEEAAQQEAAEAEGPHQVDGLGVRLQVVGQVRLHRTRYRLPTQQT